MHITHVQAECWCGGAQGQGKGGARSRSLLNARAARADPVARRAPTMCACARTSSRATPDLTASTRMPCTRAHLIQSHTRLVSLHEDAVRALQQDVLVLALVRDLRACRGGQQRPCERSGGAAAHTATQNVHARTRVCKQTRGWACVARAWAAQGTHAHPLRAGHARAPVARRDTGSSKRGSGRYG